MCFSASASFIAGTVLVGVGLATMRRAPRPSDLPFAAIPVLFGIQQLIEGLIWLSFRDGSTLSNPSLTLAYSLFSHVLWPWYVPFAVRGLETVAWRRQALLATQVAGLAVGGYLLVNLLKFPITSRVLGAHIVYETPHFYFGAVMGLYLVATCLSSLLASDRLVRVFGALTLLAFLAAYAIHAATLVSVWCFFAALLSVLVYRYFSSSRAPSAPVGMLPGAAVATASPRSAHDRTHAP